jgi:hypothetical protein
MKSVQPIERYMGCWSSGVMEYWSVGVLEYWIYKVFELFQSLLYQGMCISNKKYIY